MAIDRAFEVIPTYQLPLGRTDMLLLEAYYRAGVKEKGSALAEAMFKTVSEELDYFFSFPSRFSNSIAGEMQDKQVVLYYLCDITRRYDRNLFETFGNYWNTLFPTEPIDAYFGQDMFEEWDDDE